MTESIDVKETIVANLVASMTSNLHDLAYKSFREPNGVAELAVIIEAWHLAFTSFYTTMLGLSQSTGDKRPSETVSSEINVKVIYFAKAAQESQSADYFALWVADLGRIKLLNWPERDAVAADAFRLALRKRWDVELEEDYRKERAELGVLRLTYEQRDVVRNKFWAHVWFNLVERAEWILEQARATIQPESSG